MAVHEVVEELEDDEVDAVAGHVPGGHGGQPPVEAGRPVLSEHLLQALAGAAVVAGGWGRCRATCSRESRSCPHTSTGHTMHSSLTLVE